MGEDSESYWSLVARQESSESRVTRWILLDGNRLLLAGMLLALVFLAVNAMTIGELISIREFERLTVLFSVLLGGMLPFTTVVVAINQLILSSEYSFPGELRDRLDGMNEFRREVAAVTDAEVPPEEPSDFLVHLLESIQSRAAVLQDVEQVDDPAASEAITDFGRAVADQADRLNDRLVDGQLDTFDVISIVLDYNNSGQQQAARAIRAEHGDALPADADAALVELIDLLEYVDIARQHFRTVYAHQELARASRYLLYAGFVALFGGGFATLVYAGLLDRPPGGLALELALSGTVAVIFAPFAIFISYLLRSATLARRTAGFGPFNFRQRIEK